jgi:hypothetical protein
LVSEKVFAAIAAGSDEALNEVFARLLSTNGAAFDAELMGMLPDILTNHGPDRLRREVVYEAQLACFRRLDDTAEELQERIGYWWERVERLERRGTGGIVLEPATDSDPSAPHIIGADYEEATFAEYFELAYSESRF